MTNLHQIKLEDGISLNFSNHKNPIGRVKRFFHVLSFELYLIKIRTIELTI